MTPFDPILNRYGAFCPVCRFILEPRDLSSGKRVYIHNFRNDYINEQMGKYSICINNQAIFLETSSGLVRLEAMP